jgi:hypothetical protein
MLDNSSIVLSSTAEYPSSFHQKRHWLVKSPIYGTKAKSLDRSNRAVHCHTLQPTNFCPSASRLAPSLSPISAQKPMVSVHVHLLVLSVIIFLDYNRTGKIARQNVTRNLTRITNKTSHHSFLHLHHLALLSMLTHFDAILIPLNFFFAALFCLM